MLRVKILEEYESKETNQSVSSQSAMITQKHMQKRNKSKKNKPEKVDSQNQKLNASSVINSDI